MSYFFPDGRHIYNKVCSAFNLDWWTIAPPPPCVDSDLLTDEFKR